MKYAIIDQTNGDSFEKIFETAEQAISEAECEVDEDGCADYNTVNPSRNTSEVACL